jgi:hypothetical protein
MMKNRPFHGKIFGLSRMAGGRLQVHGYHEAGHAVIALYYGIKITLICVDGDREILDGYKGIVETEQRHTTLLNRDNWGMRIRERAHKEGVLLVSGIMAQAKMLGVYWRRPSKPPEALRARARHCPPEKETPR